MPYFMDRHNLEDSTAAEVAAAHLRDLEIQDDYGVNFLTYWYDHTTNSGFCLVEAPSADVANKVHEEAHGMVANKIIPVDKETVGHFMGSMEDPTQRPEGATSGFRAIFFSDIEGSTAMTQRLGDDESIRLLGIHDAIVRTALGENAGREVKHTGDGIMASFSSVTDALGCAIAVQRALAEHRSANPDEEVRVRIGVGAGEPVSQDDDLFGAAVQLASRLCDQGDAGDIVVSSVVREMAIGKKFEFSDFEEVELKGFPDPVRVCLVRWE